MVLPTVEYKKIPSNGNQDLPTHLQDKIASIVDRADSREALSELELAKEEYNNFTLPGNRDTRPIEVQMQEITDHIYALGNPKTSKLRQPDKAVLKEITTSAKNWVSGLNPESTPESKEVWDRLPEPQRDIIFAVYKGEIADTLEVVGKFTTSETSNVHSRYILNKILTAKNSGNPINEAAIRTELTGRMPAEEITRIVSISRSIQALGPAPFHEYVEQHFGKINMGSPISPIEVENKAHSLLEQRSVVFEEVIKALDHTTDKPVRPRWEQFDIVESSWGELAKHIDHKTVVDSTVASRHMEKSWWRDEHPKKTQQVFNLIRANALRTDEDGKKRDKPVHMLSVAIFAEHKLHEEEGVAYVNNPWVKDNVFSANYDTLTKCVEGIKQLDAALIVDGQGKLIEKPVYRSKEGYLTDSLGVTIRPPIHFRIPMVQNKQVRGLDVDEETYFNWGANLRYAASTFEAQGFKYDPDANPRRNTIEVPADKVDIMRQKIEIEEIGGKQIKAMKKEKAPDGDIQDLEVGMGKGANIYRVFAERYQSLSEYKRIAESRVRERGIPEGSLEWYKEIDRETSNVSLEMAFLEMTLKQTASQVYDLALACENTNDTDAKNKLRRMLTDLDVVIYNRMALRLIFFSQDMLSVDPDNLEAYIKTLLASHTKQITAIVPYQGQYDPPEQAEILQAIRNMRNQKGTQEEEQRILKELFERFMHDTEVKALGSGAPEEIVINPVTLKKRTRAAKTTKAAKPAEDIIDVEWRDVTDEPLGLARPQLESKVSTPGDPIFTSSPSSQPKLTTEEFHQNVIDHQEAIILNVMQDRVGSSGIQLPGIREVTAINRVLAQMGEPPMSPEQVKRYNLGENKVSASGNIASWNEAEIWPDTLEIKERGDIRTKSAEYMTEWGIPHMDTWLTETRNETGAKEFNFLFPTAILPTQRLIDMRRPDLLQTLVNTRLAQIREIWQQESAQPNTTPEQAKERMFRRIIATDNEEFSNAPLATLVTTPGFTIDTPEDDFNYRMSRLNWVHVPQERRPTPRGRDENTIELEAITSTPVSTEPSLETTPELAEPSLEPSLEASPTTAELTAPDEEPITTLAPESISTPDEEPIPVAGTVFDLNNRTTVNDTSGQPPADDTISSLAEEPISEAEAAEQVISEEREPRQRRKGSRSRANQPEDADDEEEAARRRGQRIDRNRSRGNL